MNINEATLRYAREHENEDVRQLALQGSKDAETDLTMALQQIAGRQTAKRKLPSWAEQDGIVYPPHLNMEQCSSEQTARYKQQLATSITPKDDSSSLFVDLTGGFGVDFYWLSQAYRERIYVEQNAELCQLAEHNFQALNLECTVCCCDTATYLTEMPHASLVFLDPARRNEQGGRTYGIADCSPNVLELLPLLTQKSDRVMLKLSPMLDWRKAVNDLDEQLSTSQHRVSQVHIVSVNNECKELLLLIDKEQNEKLRLCCVNNDSSFDTSYSLSANSPNGSDREFAADGLRVRTRRTNTDIEEERFLYEPNASVMKAGCFAELEARLPAYQLSVNSHLFLSSDEIDDFPGRGFQILSISSMNKRELHQKLSSMESANISVRNFPLSADQLRKKLKLKDGGSVYIFATTLQNGEHKLFICRKIS